MSDDIQHAPKPRVRAGAIAWGLVVMAIAVSVLVTVSSADSRELFADWVGRITPAGFAIGAVLAVGAFILLLAVLAIIRRVQRR
jgi:hypothetical protein